MTRWQWSGAVVVPDQPAVCGVEYRTNLGFAATDQQGILEGVLRDLLKFGVVLVQDLDLLDAGHGRAVVLAPDRRGAAARGGPGG